MTDFDDFKDDDVIIIQGETGISISQKKSRLLLFKRENAGASPPWKIIAELPLSKIRNFEKVDGVIERPAEVTVRVGGGLGQAAAAIGEGIGGALGEAVAARKAKKETGLLFDLDWFDEPLFFVNISDAKARNQAIVCLRQIFEGRKTEGSVREIDNRVARSFPNQEMRERIAREAAVAESRIRRFYWIASPVILVVFGFFAVFLGIKFIEDRNNRFLNAYRSAVFRDPDALANATGDACILIQRGYSLAVERGGPQATHIYDSFGAPGTGRFQFSGADTCYFAYVVVNEEQETVSITGANYCGIDPGNPSSPTPLTAEDMRFFAPLTPPTC